MTAGSIFFDGMFTASNWFYKVFFLYLISAMTLLWLIVSFWGMGSWQLGDFCYFHHVVPLRQKRSILQTRRTADDSRGTFEGFLSSIFLGSFDPCHGNSMDAGISLDDRIQYWGNMRWVHPILDRYSRKLWASWMANDFPRNWMKQSNELGQSNVGWNISFECRDLDGPNQEFYVSNRPIHLFLVTSGPV